MKKQIVAASLCLMAMTPASAQWATIDAAAIVQMKMQLEQLKQQYQQVEKGYDAFNGSRGVSNILQRPELRKFLPQEWQQVYDSVQRGERSGLSGKINAIKDANAVLGADRVRSLSASTAADLNRQRNSAAIAQGTAEESYRRSSERIDYLQSLTSRIEQSQDPKAIMDLQAGIAVEQAQIQNEQIRLQLAAQLQAAEQRAGLQREREQVMKMTGNSPVRIR